MNIKQISEICEQKILDVIVNHVRIRKTIIGKWVMSLPEWLDTLQVSLRGIKYPDWSLSLVSSSPRCLSGWPRSRPLCSTPWWWPASPRWARPGTGTPCCCSSPPVSVSASRAASSPPLWWWMKAAGEQFNQIILDLSLFLSTPPDCIFWVFFKNRMFVLASGASSASVTTWTWSGKYQ